MALTHEQQDVVDTALVLFKDAKDELLKVSAVAGAGKTHTLIQLTKAIKPHSAIYLAYNKAIQLEAAEKFKGTRVVCKTMHALAYGKTVKQYGLDVRFFTPRDITEKFPYEVKQQVVKILESFLLSGSTDINKFLADKADKTATKLILKYYSKMMDGTVGGGHSFYLKLYHLLLANGTIQPPNVDLLMVDEFGDITALTIEIFKLVNAKLKVAVGDSSQNIYSFTHTIDGFEVLKKEGTMKSLTQSFRVSEEVAERIETFCNDTFADGIVFKGRKMTGKEEDTSHAYIARNNSGLINKMFELEARGVPFNLTRKPEDIFGLMITLASLKPGKVIYDERYKWLEKVATKYDKAFKAGKTKKRSVRAYLASEYSEDSAIKSALSVLSTHTIPAIFDIYEKAKEHAKDKKNHYITLTTAHSSKGLEFTSVTILEDLNKAADTAMKMINALNPETHAAEINRCNEELRLYYVACSRCMLHLHNSTYC